MNESPSVITKTDNSIPFKNCSITTLELASPNFASASMFFNSAFASGRLSKIRTPLPAHKPSAFKTKGGFNDSRNAYPSDNVSFVNVAYFAVGIL